MTSSKYRRPRRTGLSQRTILDELLGLAEQGIAQIKAAQMEIVARTYVPAPEGDKGS